MYASHFDYSVSIFSFHFLSQDLHVHPVVTPPNSSMVV